MPLSTRIALDLACVLSVLCLCLAPTLAEMLSIGTAATLSDSVVETNAYANVLATLLGLGISSLLTAFWCRTDTV